ncbi:hypothetical protein SO802_014876 [Lithocarpus litseifolius]|uniref:Secreted protein n=1 Tax=Lithocarpus litseifolius TaxID=425828 RepID=A0AAW2CS73_9ROSI
MSFLCAMAAPASPPSAFSSSSPLLCFHCRQETSEFKKGWKLRAGGYAGLCIRCGKETHSGIGRSSRISEGAKMEGQGEVYERQPLRSLAKANDLFFLVVVREEVI